MIMVKLSGGLGNQMFQYACGRAVALRLNTFLLLDTSFYRDVPSRKFLLNQFAIRARVATEEEVHKLHSPLQKTLDLLRWHKRTVREKSMRFDESILSVRDNTYLDGYWQCEKYFGSATDKLLQEFELKNTFGPRPAEVARLIGESNSVSVHIRRGDYVSNRKFAAIHGALPMDYYARAMEAIEQKIDNPHYFVFTDDTQWAQENFQSPYATELVSGTRVSEWEEIRLMSLCHHHIIANSSFSWWGAWLDQNPEKIVIAPKQWMHDQSKDSRDIVPESWIQL